MSSKLQKEQLRERGNRKRKRKRKKQKNAKSKMLKKNTISAPIEGTGENKELAQ